jgi:siroheme decarboxylase
MIRRFGLVVRHHELGYRANAMTVWDVPDERVPGVAARLIELPFVTLCYRRPRRPPAWPYNLFCMIHGKDRGLVEAEVEEATRTAGLAGLPRAVLFSRRRFKQRGARYVLPGPATEEARWTRSTAGS